MRLLASLLTLALTAACATPTGPLRVGSDLANPPFAEVDAAGRRLGRDVEMMEALGARIGREIEWVRMDFDELFAAVEGGEVDVACATIGITDERRRHIAFSRPYYRTAIAVIVRRGEGEPHNLRELEGLRIAAGAGTTSEYAAKKRLGRSTVVIENDKGLGAAERLASGEVDAVVMDAPAADLVIEASEGAFARLAEDLAVERYALALNLRHGGLLHELDQALYDLDLAGGLDELDLRFGLRDSARR